MELERIRCAPPQWGQGRMMGLERQRASWDRLHPSPRPLCPWARSMGQERQRVGPPCCSTSRLTRMPGTASPPAPGAAPWEYSR
eukprot:scaffold126914_cov32-Tisochrysis_lutea.AAC.2